VIPHEKEGSAFVQVQNEAITASVKKVHFMPTGSVRAYYFDRISTHYRKPEATLEP
jgi:hypothetical protein